MDPLLITLNNLDSRFLGQNSEKLYDNYNKKEGEEFVGLKESWWKEIADIILLVVNAKCNLYKFPNAFKTQHLKFYWLIYQRLNTKCLFGKCI